VCSLSLFTKKRAYVKHLHAQLKNFQSMAVAWREDRENNEYKAKKYEKHEKCFTIIANFINIHDK